MAAFSVKLTENDVPGAKFYKSEISEHSVIELTRWLQCRGLSSAGKKQELIDRYVLFVYNCCT